MLTGNHDAKGIWRIFNYDATIYLPSIEHLLTDDRLQTISFKDIGSKQYNILDPEWIRINKLRLMMCDYRYPGILLKDTPNPPDKPYRLIDGKHRMTKMEQNHINSAPFYIFTLDEIASYFHPLKWRSKWV